MEEISSIIPKILFDRENGCGHDSWCTEKSGKGNHDQAFAANNQEDNRYGTNAHVGERALREIYLKGFEIAVRESKPMSIMTSYNLLNATHTANSYDLIQKWQEMSGALKV